MFVPDTVNNEWEWGQKVGRFASGWFKGRARKAGLGQEWSQTAFDPAIEGGKQVKLALHYKSGVSVQSENSLSQFVQETNNYNGAYFQAMEAQGLDPETFVFETKDTKKRASTRKYPYSDLAATASIRVLENEEKPEESVSEEKEPKKPEVPVEVVKETQEPEVVKKSEADTTECATEEKEVVKEPEVVEKPESKVVIPTIMWILYWTL